MNDEQFEELMRDAALSFRKPPEPDLDAMWLEVDGRREMGDGKTIMPNSHRPTPISHRAALIAATLIIGITIGRMSASHGNAPEAAPVTTVASNETGPYDVETSRYLGQTAALLIALPSEVKAGRAGEQFVGRAGELLTRTRLLLDSPAANDPQMHDLLEDLELVLAQVVRLQNDTTSRTELKIISRALEQRDVIPRLRTAVADISAN
jgi:hypothetical protein